MILRACLLFCGLLIAAIAERSFFSFLPEPLRLVTPVLVIGLSLMHFIHPWTGCLWLIFGGLLLDVLEPVHVPSTVTFLLAGLAGVFLGRWVFTNRSLYAMMGLGTLVFLIKAAVELLWLSLSGRAVPWMVELKAGGVFLLSLFLTSFLAYWLRRSLHSRFILRRP